MMGSPHSSIDVYIKKKVDPDHSPVSGVACKPVPKTQTVGGECGILFDTSYPTGAIDKQNLALQVILVRFFFN